MKLKTRIFLAFFIGLIMVGATLWWSKNHPQAPNEGEVTLNFVGPDRTFIQISDQNSNNIPDWQEALVKGESVSLDGISSTTVYAPETETGKALMTMTEQYLLAKANDEGEYSLEELLDETDQNLTNSAQDEQYQEIDINLKPTIDATALRNYGNAIVDTLLDHPLPPGTRNELEILNDALARDKYEILAELDPIIKAYEGTLADMLIMPVPQNMAAEHLALTNVYKALLEDIKAFRGVFDDAVPSLLRTRRYPADNIALYTAITNLYEKLDRLGIKWSSEDSAATLIKIE